MNLELLKSKAYEVSNNKSYIDITYILATADIANLNGALFTKAELEKAKDTIKNEPLIIVGSEPSGHDLINFPSITEGQIIGTHIDSWLGEDAQGISHLYTKARVWKIRYEEVANNLLQLHSNNNLQFSMECSYDGFSEVGSARALQGVNFIGSATVDAAAGQFSRSLEVAKQLKGEMKVNLEEAKEKIRELEADLKECKAGVPSQEDKEKASKYDSLKAEKDILDKSVEQAGKKIEVLEGELNTLETEKAEQEIKEKQETRFEEIAKYVDFEETEIASQKETYGKMDDETWTNILEIAKRNRKNDGKNISVASDTRLNIQSGFLDGLGE